MLIKSTQLSNVQIPMETLAQGEEQGSNEKKTTEKKISISRACKFLFRKRAIKAMVDGA